MTGIDLGPQADAVQVILDTFPKLSIEECKQLVALRDEDFWSAWSAWSAVGDDHVGHVGLTAARDALYYPLAAGLSNDGYVAAYAAALAVLLRHTIGTDGFEQAHYDALVKPWVTVTGKWAHPHDVTPPIVEDDAIEAEAEAVVRAAVAWAWSDEIQQQTHATREQWKLLEALRIYGDKFKGVRS